MGSLCERRWLLAMERSAERALGFPSFLPRAHGGRGLLRRDSGDESRSSLVVVYTPLHLRSVPRLWHQLHFKAGVAEVTGASVSGPCFGWVLLHWIIAKQLSKCFPALGGSLSVRQQLGWFRGWLLRCIFNASTVWQVGLQFNFNLLYENKTICDIQASKLS